MFAFQILSDLHLERPEDFEHLTITPRAPNLALLGNVGRLVQMARHYFNFLTTQLLQFKTVFLVLGNYEVHGSKWSTVKDAIDTYRLLVERKRECGQELGQFVLLDRKAVHMNAGEDRLTVPGCTLFSKTPHDGDCFLDFDMTTDWNVTKHNEEHLADIRWLRWKLAQLEHSGRKIVILTHKSPSGDTRCTFPPGLESENLLDDPSFESSFIKLWAFGHTYRNVDYRDWMGRRIYSNQRGLDFSRLAEFNSEATVEV